MQFIFAALLCCFSCSTLAAFEIGFDRLFTFNKVKNEAAVINWAQKNLPKKGILEYRGGFIYLKVDDDYINQLFPLLDNPLYEKPPFFRRYDSIGAHISVFYVQETRKIGRVKEIGQRFTFKVLSLAAVPPKTREFIVLKVASPQLEQLRKKYGLKPYLEDHDFHITIAKKKYRGRWHFVEF